MIRSRAAVLVAIAGLLTSGLVPVAMAKPATVSVAHARGGTRPAPRLPASYEGSSKGKHAVELVEWRNPRSRQLRKIVVRYARGPVAPKTVHRGHGVHLTKRRAQSAKLSKLAPDAGYSVSIFAVYRNGRTSRPAVVRFTTPGVAAKKATVRGTLRGIVTDANGAPLVHADVEATAYDVDGLADTVTDAAGRYVLGVAPGTWSVSATGSRATGGNSDATGYSYDSNTVQVHANRTTAAPKLALPAGASVSGRIVNEAGAPVAGASPYLAPAMPYDDSFDNGFGLDFVSQTAQPDPRTGADGRFELRGVAAGEALTLCGYGERARVAGKAVDLLSSCRKRTRAVAAGHAVALPDLTLHTGTGSVVTGRLRNAKGRGLLGYIELTGGDGDREFDTFTDPDGRFRIPGVVQGHYRLCGAAATSAGSRTGYQTGCNKKRVAVGRSGSTHANRTLTRGAAATGTVVGANGRRLSGVAVSVFGDHGSGFATTNSLGQWRAVGLGKGKYTACFGDADLTRAGTGVQSTCWHDGKTFATRVGRVRSGINATLHAGAAVTGVVRDRGGRPVPFAEITVGPASALANGPDDDEDDDFYTAADGAGRYRVPSLPDGAYRVCASDPESDFGTGTAHDLTCGSRVRARAGATTTTPPIVLTAATAISARVLDSTGTPVAGVDVASLASCTTRYCEHTNLLGATKVLAGDSEMTDANGTTVLSVAAGRYAVCAFGYYGTTVSGGSPTGYADTCHGAGFDVTVRAHATTTVTITLADGGAVAGRVVDRAGRGVARARIVVPGSTIDDVPGWSPGLSDDEFDFGDGDGESAFDPAFPSVELANSTDAAGRYEVIGVRPGRWSACAVDRESDPPRFATTCSGGAKATVAVTAGVTTTANIAVTRR